MKRLNPFAVAFALAVVLAWAAGAQEKVTPEQQIQQLQQQLAARTSQLGACNKSLGELGEYQQQVSAGVLVSWPQVKAVIEQSNPGMALSLTDFKVSEKPKKE